MNNGKNIEVNEVEQGKLACKAKASESRRRLEEALEQRIMRYYTDDYYFGNETFSAMRDENPDYDIFE